MGYYHWAGNPASIFLVFIVLSAFISGCFPFCDRELSQTETNSGIDLSKIPDGLYRGNYLFNDTEYHVDVRVESHRIREVKVVSGLQRVFVKKCALCEVDDLIKQIIEWQSLDVDAVSGATQTGRAVVNAIGNALGQPYRKKDGG